MHRQTGSYEVAVVGGGIVGLATAMELLAERPSTRLVLLEKEPRLAAHQTSHNSGVIHSGIYYRPGSMKARTCVEGGKLLREFCDRHGVPYAICGKVVVAADLSELSQLEQLCQRGMMNGVQGVSLIGPERLQEIEPHARGVKALHVASAGIVDYASVADAMASVIQRQGGTILTGTRVDRLVRQNSAWVLETTQGAVQSTFLIICGGLYADRIAEQAGAPPSLKIIPFRGDYYELAPARRSLIRAMVYPVPNPSLPFLGVHFTRALSGEVHVGPNAVLALKREGYRKTDVDAGDTMEMLTYPGFWRMACRYGVTGLGEVYRAWNRRAFARAAQRLVPVIRAEDLIPGGSGVRAQAVDRRGRLVDDFDIVAGHGAIHVRNVPSPAATASISIGRTIARQAFNAFELSQPVGAHPQQGQAS